MAKIGEGSLAAMGRLGLKELRNAFNPSKDSIADSELGLYGSSTQGEIAEARSDKKGNGQEQSLTMQDIRSVAQTRETERDQGIDGREPDRGIEM